MCNTLGPYARHSLLWVVSAFDLKLRDVHGARPLADVVLLLPTDRAPLELRDPVVLDDVLYFVLGPGPLGRVPGERPDGHSV